MKKTRLITMLSAFALAAAGAVGFANFKENKKPDQVVAADTNITSVSKIYRFRAPTSNWGNNVYIHLWGSADSSNDTSWPGINISNQYSYNESSQKVFTYTTNVTDYTFLKFHNNSGWETDNITIGSDTAWWLDDGNSPTAWASVDDQTYYFYDYKNAYPNAKCYAWQSNGKLQNATYPGTSMTKVQYGSGQLYSITLDCAFDEVIFGLGDGQNSGDVWVNQNRGQTYCLWKTGDHSWSNDLDWVKGHDWIYNTMHVRDIETSNNNDTNACRGNNGYYKKAKEAYNSFSPAIKTKIHEDDCFDIATARFSAWAEANGEIATWSGTSLSISSLRTSMFPTTNLENTNTIAIIVIISLVSVTAIGGFFFIRKRKEN